MGEFLLIKLVLSGAMLMRLFVVGALQILAVAVYNHYKRIYFESVRKGGYKSAAATEGYFEKLYCSISTF